MCPAQHQLITNLCDIRVLQRIDHTILDCCPLVWSRFLKQADPGAGPLVAAFYPPEQIALSVSDERNGHIVHIKTVHTMKSQGCTFVNPLLRFKFRLALLQSQSCPPHFVCLPGV
ncbi:hypothetical protein D3C81_1999470 [compost metagenome]